LYLQEWHLRLWAENAGIVKYVIVSTGVGAVGPKWLPATVYGCGTVVAIVNNILA